MTPDDVLIERLRNIDSWSRDDGGPSMMVEVADRLAALIAERDGLKEALANSEAEWCKLNRLQRPLFDTLKEVTTTLETCAAERDELKDIIKRRLDCDGSNGAWDARLNFDLTEEMRGVLPKASPPRQDEERSDTALPLDQRQPDTKEN